MMMVVVVVVQVYWGHISIVYAEMNCLRDLLRYNWKYFINLSGFMFPAHTNRDLVQILRLYDGANDVEGSFIRYVLAFFSVFRACSSLSVCVFRLADCKCKSLMKRSPRQSSVRPASDLEN